MPYIKQYIQVTLYKYLDILYKHYKYVYMYYKYVYIIFTPAPSMFIYKTDKRMGSFFIEL